jgi:hypothetical protein
VADRKLNSRALRIGALGLMAAGLLAAPASSSASPGTDSAVCTFNAQTTAMDPMSNFAPSSGTYSFTTSPTFESIPTRCTYTDADGAVDGHDDTGLYNATINGSGGYISNVCGTGSSSGNATLNLGGTGETSPITFAYGMTFAGDEGVSTGTIKTSTATLAGRPATGVGALLIRWTPQDPRYVACDKTPASGFAATGVIAFVATA